MLHLNWCVAVVDNGQLATSPGGHFMRSSHWRLAQEVTLREAVIPSQEELCEEGAPPRPSEYSLERVRISCSGVPCWIIYVIGSKTASTSSSVPLTSTAN